MSSSVFFINTCPAVPPAGTLWVSKLVVNVSIAASFVSIAVSFVSMAVSNVSFKLYTHFALGAVLSVLLDVNSVTIGIAVDDIFVISTSTFVPTVVTPVVNTILFVVVFIV